MTDDDPLAGIGEDLKAAQQEAREEREDEDDSEETEVEDESEETEAPEEETEDESEESEADETADESEATEPEETEPEAESDDDDSTTDDDSTSADDGAEIDWEADDSGSADDDSGSTEESAGDQSSAGSATPDDDIHRDPAFPFAADMQRPIYPRRNTWEDWEDARDFEVERFLRERDVREVAKREIHDAVLRVAAERPEAVARQVMRARDLDPDEREG